MKEINTKFLEFRNYTSDLRSAHMHTYAHEHGFKSFKYYK